MKRLLAIVFSLLVFWGCEKETILSVDQTSINISDVGGSSTVSLTANKPWSASSNQSWCKISPSSGEEATSSRINILCDPNTTYDARNATITFTCAELTKQVSITQTMNNGLMVTQTSYELTKAAQQINIEVKANVKFSVEVDSGCKDWVKYNTTKGLTTSTVVLDIAENKTYDSREGKVTIKQDGGSLSSTITIKQSQLDGLFLTTSEYNLSNEKHTLTVEVSTNVEFDVKPEADWVKYVQTKGLSTKQIVLEVAENDTYDQRETKVNVKQKNGNLSGTITIKQDEKYGILVTQSEYSLTNEAQTIEVEVKYNVDFDVVIPDGCKDWIKQVSTKGLNTKNYTFSITNNKTYDNREGIITFKQKNGSLSGTVAIKQAQTDYLEVSKNEFTVDIEGEIISIQVTSNVDYTVAISEDALSWLSIVETKGLSKDNLQIAVSAGDDYTDRTGEILVSYGDLKQTILVHQYSYASNTIIKFADEKIKAKLVEAYDTNGDGELSIREARSVESIVGVLGAIKTYTSFDELSYFTGVTAIPDGLFKQCTNLTSISLPESITSIGSEAFYECTSLSRIRIPQSVMNIWHRAFYGCSNITTVDLSSGRPYIYDEAFAECTNLESVIEGSPIVISKRTFCNCRKLTDISLKSPLRIDSEAFYNCESLREIVIPEGVACLNRGTFYGCTGLKRVILPESIKNIYSQYVYVSYFDSGYRGCFQNCSSLESVNLPKDLKVITKYTFAGCTSLSSIVIPEGVTSIEEHAFGGCPFTSLSLPNTVSIIGKYAFGGGLFESLVIPKRVSEISDGAFGDCYNLKNVFIHDAVTSIGAGSFSGCTSLTEITIPESVVSIGNEAFSHCSSLSKITIPESVISIGDQVFAHCNSLRRLEIPATVRSLGIFKECDGLEEIVINCEMESIGNYFFQGCTKLINITLPKSVQTIGDYAFYGCRSLTHITIPEAVTKIGERAFANNESLVEITIPENVTTLGLATIRDCPSLDRITFLPTTPPYGVGYTKQSYEAQNFLNTNNCPVFVPAGSVNAYMSQHYYTNVKNRIQAIPE